MLKTKRLAKYEAYIKHFYPLICKVEGNKLSLLIFYDIHRLTFFFSILISGNLLKNNN